jgi:hypothetical protein
VQLTNWRKLPPTTGKENKMPKELEQKLMKDGKKQGLKGDRLNAYVYGTLRKLGWKPTRKRNKAN